MSAPVRRRSGFQRLAVVTTAATLLLIAVGGLVRATGSGLACPDWPLCYGKVIPRQADVPPASGYTLWHVWLEHSHRLLASLVGVALLALAVWAVRAYRRRPDVLLPTLAAAVLVALQAWLGRQVVLGSLEAALVTAHLGMAFAVAGCVAVAAVHAGGPRRAGGHAPGYAHGAAGVAGVAYVQALLGSAVTGHGAGLSFTDFPLMAGAVVPPLSSLAAGLHAAHRYGAAVLLAAVTALCAAAVSHGWRLTAAGVTEADRRAFVRLPMRAATLVVAQVLLGAANLWSDLSAWTVVPHLTVASWIWLLLVVHAAQAYRLTPSPGATAVPDRALGVVGAGRR